mgnify:CR=1 FL=1
MQNMTIDTGMQEYLINNRAVLRFNPSDPNLYHRFFAAAPKLDALDAELTEQLKALPAKPDDARAERGLALLTDYDHRIKALLTEIFGGENDFDKVLEGVNLAGTGANGNDAVSLYAEHAPDIALLDIQMPGRDGLSAAREILERDPAARVVFLTTFSDDEYIVSALKLGARGYLIKTDVAAIPPALAQVMDGKRVLEGKAIEDIDFDGTGADASTPRRPAAFASLTDREFEVAELIARGLDNKEIAAAAYMGEGTVRNHISSILAKMGLRNRTQIAIAYLRG